MIKKKYNGVKIESIPDLHENMYKVPDVVEFEKLKKYLKGESIDKREEFYIYPMIVVDSKTDRHNERFSIKALEDIVEKLPGTVVLSDHDWDNVSKSVGRVYEAKLYKSNDSHVVVGYCYTTLAEVKSRIGDGTLKSVSIGFEGVSKQDNEGVGVYEEVTDVYEVSFVNVPAQKGAGLIKTANKKERGENMEIKKLQEENKKLKQKVEELETKAKTEKVEQIIAEVKAGKTFHNEKAEGIADVLIEEVIVAVEDIISTDTGEVVGKIKEVLDSEDYTFLYTLIEEEVEEIVEELEDVIEDIVEDVEEIEEENIKEKGLFTIANNNYKKKSAKNETVRGLQLTKKELVDMGYGEF